MFLTAQTKLKKSCRESHFSLDEFSETGYNHICKVERRTADENPRYAERNWPRTDDRWLGCIHCSGSDPRGDPMIRSFNLILYFDGFDRAYYNISRVAVKSYLEYFQEFPEFYGYDVEDHVSLTSY